MSTSAAGGAAQAAAGHASIISVATHDRKRLWAVMCLLGIGTLAAFNVCLNAIPYFETYLGPDVAYRISAAFTVIQLGLQPIILVYGHKTTPLARIIGACTTQAVIMILAPLLGIKGDFWITVVMASAGAATAVLEASVFGFLSAMPAYASAGLLVGEAAIGLAASLAQLLVKGLIPDNASRAAALYFGTASVLLATCAGASWWLRSHPVVLATGANRKRNPFALVASDAAEATSAAADATALKELAEGASANGSGEAAAAPLGAGFDGGPQMQWHSRTTPPAASGVAGGSAGLVADAAATEAVDLRPLQPEPVLMRSSSSDGWDSAGAAINPLRTDSAAAPFPADLESPHFRSGSSADTAAVASAAVASAAVSSQAPLRQLLGPSWLPLGMRAWLAAMWRVLEAIWPGALAVLLNFVATFLVLPGVMASIPYRGGYEPFQKDGGWWTVSLFALFSTGDLLGRAAAPHVQVGGQRRILLYSVIKLFIAPPLVLGAARGWALLGSDAGAIVAVTVLAVTNGHLASLGMVAIPQAVKSPRDGELAGFVSVVFLHAGIALGSLLALLLQE